MLFERRAAAGPSPAVRARVAALFGPAAEPPPGAAPVETPAEPPAEAPAVVAPPLLNPGVAPPLLSPGGRGAAALVAVAVAAVAVTGVVVWRGRPRPVDVAAPPVVVSAPVTPAAALLVVDVAGDVRRPGLVRLPAGSRVADALAAAGGLRRGATTAGLNLARKLVDGEQVFVGAPAPGAAAPGAPPAAAGASALVNLNTATAEQLDSLPGIGPVLAERIVEWRTANGAFASVDQLREVSGIGARKFESIRAHVTV